MKKAKLIGIILLLTITTLPFLVYVLQNFTLEKSLVSNYNEDQPVTGKSRDFIRCNINISDPEFASIFPFKDEWDIGFYKPRRIFIGSEEDWDNSYTGGTTIKNTTFDELVEMVKDDCSQFQYGYDNPDPDGPRWTYSAYIPEPEVSEEEQLVEKMNNFIPRFESWPDESKQEIFDTYGDWTQMNEEERVNWYKAIAADENWKIYIN